MAADTYHNLIGGEWVPAASGETFENRNPANTDDLVGLFAKSSRADVDRATAAAEEAYVSWRLVPAPRRAEILFRAAQLFAERKDAYARAMTREMGKVVAETAGDVQEAIDMAQLMAGEGRRLHGQTAPSELRNKFAMSVRQPIGVCGMITAWNFPMAVPSWKILPALVCGNTVVFKPAEEAPLSAIHFVQTLVDAGLPRGVLNLVMGDGPGAGAPLVSHPAVRVVSFTGSTATGRLVNEACAPGVQEGPPRDGRQERHPRDGRCATWSWRWTAPLGWLRHDGPALHGGQPGGRPRAAARRVRGPLRRARPLALRR